MCGGEEGDGGKGAFLTRDVVMVTWELGSYSEQAHFQS